MNALQQLQQEIKQMDIDELINGYYKHRATDSKVDFKEGKAGGKAYQYIPGYKALSDGPWYNAFKQVMKEHGIKHEIIQPSWSNAPLIKIDRSTVPDNIVPYRYKKVVDEKANDELIPNTESIAISQASHRLDHSDAIRTQSKLETNRILRDATVNNNALPLDILRGIRTQIGKNLGPIKGKVRIAKEGDEYLSSIYSALTKDMNAAVKGADNTEALSLLTKADRYTRLNNNLNVRKVFDEVDKRKLPSQVFDFAMQGSDAGATRINSILRNLNAEQRGALAATVLGRMGNKPGQNFSAATFLSSWKKLNPKAKQSLFGANKYQEMTKELNSLVRILDVAVERGKAENVSKTATIIQTIGTINSLFAAGGLVTYGVMSGSPGSGAAGGILAGAAMTPVAISTLITSPKFIRWMKSTAQATAKNPNQLAVQLARLGVIAERDSELAPAINEYMNNMIVTLTLPKPQENQQGQQ